MFDFYVVILLDQRHEISQLEDFQLLVVVAEHAQAVRDGFFCLHPRRFVHQLVVLLRDDFVVTAVLKR